MSHLKIKLLFLIVLGSGWLIPAYAQRTTPPAKPNIIFIIADDVSIDDIGCYGNPSVKTPNIDNLAKNGLRFTNVFVTSSSCSPSRTSILTGRYPHNTGAAELHTALPSHLTFFPEQLKQQGYYTAQLGKWHEGKETARAYDTVIAGEQKNGAGGEDLWNDAIKNRPKNKPFFLWLSPFDAHRKWSADTFTITHNPQTEVTVPATLIDDQQTREDLASYYNEIGRLDYYIGSLLRTLSELGIEKNTIIIFMSDNARPFPGSKTRLNDRGTRTPFVLNWPAGITKPGVINALISSIDIAPTLLQFAGVQPVPSIQGLSFAKLLKQPNAAFRNYIFAEHNWHDYEAYERSVRTRDYLYIYNGRPDFDNGGPIDANQSPSAFALRSARKNTSLTLLQEDAFVQPRVKEEFYVIKTDSLQVKNLIHHPSLIPQIAKLKKLLKNWQEQTGDTEPAHLTPDWYDRHTGNPLPEKDIRGEMPGASLKADLINKKGPF